MTKPLTPQTSAVRVQLFRSCLVALCGMGIAIVGGCSAEVETSDEAVESQSAESGLPEAEPAATFDLGCGWPAQREFTDVQGKTHRLGGASKAAATLLVFYGHDCPISNAYVPEFKRLAKDYGERGAAMYFVFADPHVTREEAATHAEEFELPFPGLLDRDSLLARHYGVTVMPEAALLDAEGRLIYRGRIDNLYADYGKKRREATKHELRDGLESCRRAAVATYE